jgi:hypothetical protein
VAARYFAIKPFEKDGKVYRKLGAGVFGKYWINGGSFWTRHGWWPLRLKTGRDAKSLSQYAATTKVLEGIHVALLAGSLPLVASAAVHTGNLGHAEVAAAINTLANVYPIMSLRLGRSRVEHLLERK